VNIGIFEEEQFKVYQLTVASSEVIINVIVHISDTQWQWIGSYS